MRRIFKVLMTVLILSIFATQASAVYLNETVCTNIGGNWRGTGIPCCRIIGDIIIASDISMRGDTIIQMDIRDGGSVTINPGATINIERGGELHIGNDYLRSPSAGTINNNGHINIRDGGFFGSWYGAVNNNGVIMNYGKFYNNVNVTFRNDGDIYNRPFGTIKNSGVIENRPGGTINNEISGPVKKLGLFYKGIRGGTINNKLTINNHGTINNNWIVNNEIESTIYNTADGTINNRRNINNRGTIYNCGTITGRPIQYNPFIVPVKCLELPQ